MYVYALSFYFYHNTLYKLFVNQFIYERKIGLYKNTK